MSPPAGLRKRKGSTPSASAATAAAAPSPTLGRGSGSATTTFSIGGSGSANTAAFSLGRGSGSASTGFSLGGGGASTTGAFSLGPGGGSAAATVRPNMGGLGKGAATAPSCIDVSADGFPFPPSSPLPAWWDAAGGDPSSPSPGFGRSTAWDPSWEKDPRFSTAFMRYFGSQPHNIPAISPLTDNNKGITSPEVEILYEQEQPEQVNNDSDNVRTEKRILWTEEEDVRLMSSWIEHSMDSSCGADKGGNQYWGDVVESYNKTTPSLRKRNLKQCKDRWHKINRWTDIFECAYVKARRVFTSGYSDQMWIDAAHKFYVDDNKDAKLGPFVLMEVWKTCREVPKWKTYNEELRNARKRKAFHVEGNGEEKDDSIEEMPQRPIGQKAAKKAALAAKAKSKVSSCDDDGNSKESAIDLDKLDRFSKFQEETNANRIKILELQQKLSSEKLETTKLAHLTAQETKEGKKLDLDAKKLEKESKMMEAYNNLISQDTSSMSDEEKAERVAAMKCLRKRLFPKNT